MLRGRESHVVRHQPHVGARSRKRAPLHARNCHEDHDSCYQFRFARKEYSQGILVQRRDKKRATPRRSSVRLVISQSVIDTSDGRWPPCGRAPESARPRKGLMAATSEGTSEADRPTDEQLDERFVLRGDPEEALRQLLNVPPSGDDTDEGDDEATQQP